MRCDIHAKRELIDSRRTKTANETQEEEGSVCKVRKDAGEKKNANDIKSSIVGRIKIA